MWMCAFSCHAPKDDGTRVGIALWSHANTLNDNKAWPSLSRLCNETGLSKATVCRHLGVLVERGWIVRSSGGGTESTRYVLTIPKQLERSDDQTFECTCKWCRERGCDDQITRKSAEAARRASTKAKAKDGPKSPTCSTGATGAVSPVLQGVSHGCDWGCVTGETQMTKGTTNLTTNEVTKDSGSTASDRQSPPSEIEKTRRGERTDRATELHEKFEGNAGTRSHCRSLSVDHDKYLKAFVSYMNDPDAKCYGERSTSWGATFNNYVTACVEGEESDHWRRFFDVSCHPGEYLDRATDAVDTSSHHDSDVLDSSETEAPTYLEPWELSPSPW